jgi:hypothetical protein
MLPRIHLPHRERRAMRFASWLAVFAIVWQALQPYASLAAAEAESGHHCPTTGLPSLELPTLDQDSDDSKGDRLHCGFCVGLLAPSIAGAIPPADYYLIDRAILVDTPLVDAAAISLHTAPPLPARGPPPLA